MDDVSKIFADQDGLATIAQLHAAGVTDGLRRQRLSTGEWERFDSSLFGIAGTPSTWRRQARAALLSVSMTNAALSHSTAARLHGFDGFAKDEDIHVTVAGSGHHNVLAGYTVHRSTLLTVEACVEVHGMRVVSKPIALVQIAGTHGRDATRKALDGMLRAGDSIRWIETTVNSWRHRGVKGPALVLELLSETELRLPRSFFQRLARRALARTGLRLVDEHRVDDPDTGRRLADLDLACPELMIGIECQSWEWHSTPTARAQDARRKRRLQRVGWNIIELWWADLCRPDEVLADVEHAISGRRR